MTTLGSGLYYFCISFHVAKQILDEIKYKYEYNNAQINKINFMEGYQNMKMAYFRVKTE